MGNQPSKRNRSDSTIGSMVLQDMKNDSIMLSQIKGISHYARLRNERSDSNLELIGELHDKSKVMCPGKAFEEFFSDNQRQIFCPETDFFIEIDSIYKIKPPEHNDDLSFSTYMIKNYTSCRVHAVDARSELPGIIATPLQTWDTVKKLGVSEKAQKEIDEHLYYTLVESDRLVRMILEEPNYKKWPMRMLRRMIDGISDPVMKEKFLLLISEMMKQFQIKFQIQIKGKQHDLILNLRDFQAFFMDLYTVYRCIKPYVKNGIIYAGSAHTREIQKMLEKLGFSSYEDTRVKIWTKNDCLIAKKTFSQ